MSESANRSERGGAAARSGWLRVFRWGFPLLSVAVTLLSQIFLPRILQIELSEAEYTSFVAVASIVAYVGLADAGLLVALLRELSTLHSSGDRAGFVAEALRSRRIFAGTSLLGALVASGLLGSVLDAASRSWAEAASPNFRFAAFAVLGAATLNLGGGSYHTAMLYSTGRLLFGQLTGLLSALVPLVALIAALSTTRQLAASLVIYAGAIGSLAVLRVLHANHLLSREARGVAKVPCRVPLGRMLSAGITLRIAEVVPAAVYPHLVTLVHPVIVPVAIPARTYANSCRVVTQRFLDLLQVHVTRQIAGGDAAKRRGLAEYDTAARLLSSLQLLQIGLAAYLAGAVFNLWLPAQADSVHLYLGGMLAEQCLLSAALPSWILFMAYGHLTRLGIIRLVGIISGSTTLVLLLRTSPDAALGVALTASAIPVFLFGAWCELRIFPIGDGSKWRTLMRYAIGAGAALSMLFYSGAPRTVAAAVAAAGLLGLPRAVSSVVRMFRDRANMP